MGMAACLWFSASSLAAAEDTRDLLGDNRTTKLDHGMYEIREAGREFLAKERRKKGAWEAMDPDIRAIVPRCAVPLRARWAVMADLEKNEGVEVRCMKSIDSKMRHWEILVPAYRIVEQTEKPKSSTHVGTVTIE